MTAEVVELHPGLKRLPPDPESLRERTKDYLSDAWFSLTDTFRSPIVITRRKTMQRHVKAAFDLGVECGRTRR